MDRLDHHYHRSWFDEHDRHNGPSRKIHWVRSAIRLRYWVRFVRLILPDALDLIRGSVLSATPMYPVQAPLPVTQNAPSLAFMWFLRSFASVSRFLSRLLLCS